MAGWDRGTLILANLRPSKCKSFKMSRFGSFIAYFACVLISSLTLDGRTRRDRWNISAALSLGFLILVLPLYSYDVKIVENVS